MPAKPSLVDNRAKCVVLDSVLDSGLGQRLVNDIKYLRLMVLSLVYIWHSSCPKSGSSVQK